jgi:hypothetical protein
MPAVLAVSMMVPVVVSIPCYLNIHHGWAHVSPHGWSHLTTVKCHAPTCCWESTPGCPNACLLGWHSASCWLLGCSTSVTSSFTMDKQLFVSMVGPISLLSNVMHPPMVVGPLLHGHSIPSQCASCWLLLWCPNLGTSTLTMGGHMFLPMVGPTWPLPIAMHSFVAVKQLLHGPLFACCAGSQHCGGCCGVHPPLSRHSPWMGTSFSPWLFPLDHCQVPCTHLLLGIHSYMAKCMPTRLAVSILLVAESVSC